MPNILVIGPKNSGKTTLCRALVGESQGALMSSDDASLNTFSDGRFNYKDVGNQLECWSLDDLIDNIDLVLYVIPMSIEDAVKVSSPN